MLSLGSIKFKILKSLQKRNLAIHFIKMMNKKTMRITDKKYHLK